MAGLRTEVVSSASLDQKFAGSCLAIWYCISWDGASILLCLLRYAFVEAAIFRVRPA
jgi:hypothetical protein